MHALIKPSLAQETLVLYIIIQLSLFYSPLNPRSDAYNHCSLQRKLPSSAGFKSFIFISFPCFSLHIVKNCAITWPSFLLQMFACYHLVPHMILHQMAYNLLCTSKRWLMDRLKLQMMISRLGATLFL